MKTLLSSGLIGCSLLVCFACSGDDAAAPLADTPEAAANEPASDATEAAAPADDADEATSDAPTRESLDRAPLDDPAAAASPEELPSPSLEPTELRWRSCGQFQNRNLECAELAVPIDYDQPDGEKLPIAMRRILANPLEPYKGALLINPGGPGGEGIDFALGEFQTGLFDAIAPGYDIVGFDPRGVGASGERGCGILPPDLFPNAAQTTEGNALEALLAEQRARGEQCEQAWGPLFRQLGSNNVVRDLEAMRQALREPVLNFYGSSYGTRLGALYAHEYPATTGRILLDAPVHPRVNFVELIRGQFYGAVAMHEKLFAICDLNPDLCPPDSRELFEQMLASATERGFDTEFLLTWRILLAATSGLGFLFEAFNNEALDPGGAWLEQFAFRFLGDDGGAGDVALDAVSCTDDTVEPPTPAQIESIVDEFLAVSPLFANSAVAVTTCASWPTTRDPVPVPTALEANPLLVIGGLNDWRTPYEWAPAMTEALGNATLLTSNHFGHCGVSLENECVITAVRAYLTTGSLPPSGAMCP